MSRKVAKRDEGMFDDNRTQWCQQRTQPLEVMCLGVCRTGTTSMLEALSILGYGTSYNSREMLRHGHTLYIAELLRAKHEDGRSPEIEQLESLLTDLLLHLLSKTFADLWPHHFKWGDYRTISGEPAYIFAKECLQLYPDTKVVLTVRDDEETWLRSLEKTMWYGNRLMVTGFLRYVSKIHRIMAVFTNPYWKYLFWNDVPNHGIRFYREHNAMVQRMGGDRLLVYNTKQGWEPLCSFLGKDVPSVDFPHVNKADEHRNLFNVSRKVALKNFAKSLLMKGILPSVIVAMVILRRRQIWAFLESLKR